jgi:ATP-dependent Lon protease
LVSDFLSECWTRLSASSRANVLDGSVHFGGALSGRDIEAVRKTVSGLVKLLSPDPSVPVSDADLEWIVRVALESRRRVKEQQRRVQERIPQHAFQLRAWTGWGRNLRVHAGAAFGRGHRRRSPSPGQVWAISPGAGEAGPGLYRIEINSQPGGGVRILNQPAPGAFRESVKIGEQNLLSQAKSLIGDRDPREHEFTIQLRSMDADKSGSGLGVAVLTALCGAVLGRNTRGATIIVGVLNLGGSIDGLPNAVKIAELAVEKQAQTLLLPVSARRQLNELTDDLWTKIGIEFYRDATDAVFKALVD